MTRDEALAILPPEVAARLAKQAQEATITEDQMQTLVRLFGNEAHFARINAGNLDQAAELPARIVLNSA
jgi:hypothetical protein